MKFRSYLTCIVIFLVVLMGISYKIAELPTDHLNSSEQSSSVTLKQNAQSKSDGTEYTIENADTDGRSDDPDLLYSRGGVSVRLIESDLSRQTLRFEMTNDSPDEVIISTDAVAVNGFVSSAHTLAIVAPNSTETRVLTGICDDLPEKDEIDSVSLRFFIDKDDGDSYLSERVCIVYADGAHSYTPPKIGKLVYEGEGLKIWSVGSEVAENYGEKQLRLKFVAENSGAERMISLTEIRAFDSDGAAVSADCFNNVTLPSETSANAFFMLEGDILAVKKVALKFRIEEIMAGADFYGDSKLSDSIEIEI